MAETSWAVPFFYRLATVARGWAGSRSQVDSICYRFPPLGGGGYVQSVATSPDRGQIGSSCALASVATLRV
jgi:hypothetical protein